MKRLACALLAACVASLAAAQGGGASPGAGSFGFNADFGSYSDVNIGMTYYLSDRFLVAPFVGIDPWAENKAIDQQNKGNIYEIGTYAFYEAGITPSLSIGLGGMLSYKRYDDSYVTKYLPTTYEQINSWDIFYLDGGPALQARYSLTPKLGIYLRYVLLFTYMQINYTQKDTFPPGYTNNTTDWYFNIDTWASNLGVTIFL
jgi:hypothetical protein